MGACPWGEFGVDGSEVFFGDKVGDDDAAVAREDGEDVFNGGGGGDGAEGGSGDVGLGDRGWDGEGEAGHFGGGCCYFVVEWMVWSGMMMMLLVVSVSQLKLVRR